MSGLQVSLYLLVQLLKIFIIIIDLAAFWPFLGRYSTSLPHRRPVETLIQRDSGRINMEDLCSSLSDMLTGHSAVGRAPNSHAVALP